MLKDKWMDWGYERFMPSDNSTAWKQYSDGTLTIVQFNNDGTEELGRVTLNKHQANVLKRKLEIFELV
jgi:hypothetical protein